MSGQAIQSTQKGHPVEPRWPAGAPSGSEIVSGAIWTSLPFASITSYFIYRYASQLYQPEASARTSLTLRVAETRTEQEKRLPGSSPDGRHCYHFHRSQFTTHRACATASPGFSRISL